jgi:hypothetical protein
MTCLCAWTSESSQQITSNHVLLLLHSSWLILGTSTIHKAALKALSKTVCACHAACYAHHMTAKQQC